MNILDIILVIILVLGGFSGFKKGLILEIITFLALILGILGGFYLMHLGVDFLQKNLNLTGQFVPVLSFIMIFVAIIALVNLLGKALKKIIDMTLLGSFDNMAGAVIGVLKWGFGISIIVWLISYLEFTDQAFFANSEVIPYLQPIAPMVMDFIAVLIPYVHDLGDAIEQLIGKNEPPIQA